MSNSDTTFPPKIADIPVFHQRKIQDAILKHFQVFDDNKSRITSLSKDITTLEQYFQDQLIFIPFSMNCKRARLDTLGITYSLEWSKSSNGKFRIQWKSQNENPFSESEEVIAKPLIEAPLVVRAALHRFLPKFVREFASSRALCEMDENLLSDVKPLSIPTNEITGLPTKSVFEYEIDLAIADPFQAPLSVAFIDMDNLKKLNTDYSSRIADEVIKQVATQLEQGLRNRGKLFHRSGDEFLAILPSSDSQETYRLLARIVARIASEEYKIEGKTIKTTVSAGISTYPEHTTDRIALIDFANRAMSDAKLAGKACTRVWNWATTSASSAPFNQPGINPCYDRDLLMLDGKWKLETVLDKNTIVIVVGDGIINELLDRPIAAILRDEINKRGSGDSFKRALILGFREWEKEKFLIHNPTISIGGDGANKLSVDIRLERKAGGKDPWPDGQGGWGALAQRTKHHGPQIALWGMRAAETRSAVLSYIKRPDGLQEFLECYAKWNSVLPT